MPKGPRGERRPADINKSAFQIVRIATGDEKDTSLAVPARAAGGRAGGKARAEKLTEPERKRIAQKAAKVRWATKSRKPTVED